MGKIKDSNLYLVLSEDCGRLRPAAELARLAISGGIDILQMREKDKTRQELLKLGLELSGICRENNVTFIVNDDPAIAKETGADGVHLGQEDLAKWGLEKTRGLLGHDSVIGVSTHSLEQFKKANGEDFDYIAFGPVFPTKTKDYFIGTGDAAEILKIAEKPVVFIGGIDLDNLDELLCLGARNIAVIRAILGQADVAGAAANFREKIGRYTRI